MASCCVRPCRARRRRFYEHDVLTLGIGRAMVATSAARSEEGASTSPRAGPHVSSSQDRTLVRKPKRRPGAADERQLSKKTDPRSIHQLCVLGSGAYGVPMRLDLLLQAATSSPCEQP